MTLIWINNNSIRTFASKPHMITCSLTTTRLYMIFSYESNAMSAATGSGFVYSVGRHGARGALWHQATKLPGFVPVVKLSKKLRHQCGSQPIGEPPHVFGRKSGTLFQQKLLMNLNDDMADVPKMLFFPIHVLLFSHHFIPLFVQSLPLLIIYSL